MSDVRIACTDCDDGKVAYCAAHSCGCPCARDVDCETCSGTGFILVPAEELDLPDLGRAHDDDAGALLASLIADVGIEVVLYHARGRVAQSDPVWVPFWSGLEAQAIAIAGTADTEIFEAAQ